MTSLPIHLSSGFSSTVSVGDEVTVGQVLAEKDPQRQEEVSIAQLFAIPVKKVGKTLLVNVGDHVVPGDVLAARRRAFGLKEDRIESKVAGTISSFNRGEGVLTITLGEDEDALSSETGDVEKIISPIDGTVAICNNEKIVLETDKDVIVGEKGSGDSTEGVVHIISLPEDEKRDDMLLFELNTDVIGKVVVCPHLTKEALMKSIGIGVVGVIGTNIPEEHFSFLETKKLNTPVIAITDDGMKTLADWHGKKIYVEGGSKSIILLHA